MKESNGKTRKRFKITYGILLIPLLIALIFAIFSNHALAQWEDTPKSCDMSDKAQNEMCQLAQLYDTSLYAIMGVTMIRLLEVSEEPCGFKLTNNFRKAKETILKLKRADLFYNDLKERRSYKDIPDKEQNCVDLKRDFGPNGLDGVKGYLQ